MSNADPGPKGPIVVVSQAWTIDAGAHADAYLAITAELGAMMRAHPGYLGRRMLRSREDPTHFTHVRRFADRRAYDALAHTPGYEGFIARLTAHLRPYQGPAREIFSVALDEEPGERATAATRPGHHTFVLVHGAFRGGWAWRDVARRLRASGHDVHTPSLTGAGDRRHTSGPVGLGTWIDDVAAVLETWDLRDVVLVGHSQGGLVTTAASERLVGRVRLLAYLDAPVPAPGERGVDLVPEAAKGKFAPPPPGTMIPPAPIGPGAGIDAALAAWATARLAPQPVDPALEPVVLGAEALALPRAYAFCADTPRLYPAWVTRARLDAVGAPYHVLDCGHDAPLAAPEAVAAWLETVAASS